MKLIIEIDDTHAAFVRQQARLRDAVVRLDFEFFPALLPGRVLGELVEEAHDGYKPDGTYGHVHRTVIKTLEG